MMLITQVVLAQNESCAAALATPPADSVEMSAVVPCVYIVRKGCFEQSGTNIRATGNLIKPSIICTV